MHPLLVSLLLQAHCSFVLNIITLFSLVSVSLIQSSPQLASIQSRIPFIYTIILLLISCTSLLNTFLTYSIYRRYQSLQPSSRTIVILLLGSCLITQAVPLRSVTILITITMSYRLQSLRSASMFSACIIISLSFFASITYILHSTLTILLLLVQSTITYTQVYYLATLYQPRASLSTFHRSSFITSMFLLHYYLSTSSHLNYVHRIFLASQNISITLPSLTNQLKYYIYLSLPLAIPYYLLTIAPACSLQQQFSYQQCQLLLRLVGCLLPLLATQLQHPACDIAARGKQLR